MIVAIVTVHLKKGFFGQNGGYEYNLVLAVAALALAFTGPGSISLDAVFGRYLSGTFWGALALLIGGIGAVMPLIQRRVAPARQNAAVR
jgi:putative oxidoreductase